MDVSSMTISVCIESSVAGLVVGASPQEVASRITIRVVSNSLEYLIKYHPFNGFSNSLCNNYALLFYTQFWIKTGFGIYIANLHVE